MTAQNREVDVEALREYDDAPATPERLFVESQLRTAVQSHVPDDVTVEVNTRFKRTFTRFTEGPDGGVLEVSWDLFKDEDHYEGTDTAWAVICASASNVLNRAGVSGADL